MRTKEETLAKLSQITDDYEDDDFLGGAIDYTQIFDREDIPHLLDIFKDTSVFFDENYDEEAEEDPEKLTYIEYIHAFRALVQFKEEKIFDIYCEITPRTSAFSNEWFWEDYPKLIDQFPQQAFQFFLKTCSGTDIRTINEETTDWFIQVFCKSDRLYYHPEISEEQKSQIENTIIQVMRFGLSVPEEDWNEELYLAVSKINGFGLAALMDIGLTGKYYDFLKELFEADLIDEIIAGDLEDLEIDLGMRTERENPHIGSEIFSQILMDLENLQEEYGDETNEIKLPKNSNFTRPSKQDKKKKKEKKKAQKKARKQNRKK
jgi:hypothetical protein